MLLLKEKGIPLLLLANQKVLLGFSMFKYVAVFVGYVDTCSSCLSILYIGRDLLKITAMLVFVVFLCVCLVPTLI